MPPHYFPRDRSAHLLSCRGLSLRTQAAGYFFEPCRREARFRPKENPLTHLFDDE
jgi:hypothetical protein